MPLPATWPTRSARFGLWAQHSTGYRAILLISSFGPTRSNKFSKQDGAQSLIARTRNCSFRPGIGTPRVSGEIRQELVTSLAMRRRPGKRFDIHSDPLCRIAELRV